VEGKCVQFSSVKNAVQEPSEQLNLLQLTAITVTAGNKKHAIKLVMIDLLWRRQKPDQCELENTTICACFWHPLIAREAPNTRPGSHFGRLIRPLKRLEVDLSRRFQTKTTRLDFATKQPTNFQSTPEMLLPSMRRYILWWCYPSRPTDVNP